MNLKLEWEEDSEPLGLDAQKSDEEESENLVLNIGGYEGPLDVLLSLARKQKVDLLQISIRELAEQYLLFIRNMQAMRLELAADYLVMAAWLAWLKSRLVAPSQEEDEEEEELDAAQMAANLAFQLKRLDTFRKLGEDILARPLLFRDTFPTGLDETTAGMRTLVMEDTTWDFLSARAALLARKSQSARQLTIRPPQIMSVADAYEQLLKILPNLPGWVTLESFLPKTKDSDLANRAVIAANFGALLQMAKEKKILLWQDSADKPIFVAPRGNSDTVSDVVRIRT